MNHRTWLKPCAVAVCAAQALLFASAGTAGEALVCMSRTTQNNPSGDHEFTLSVTPTHVPELTKRGFARVTCKARKDYGRTQERMCRVAARSNKAIDADFKSIYAVTPSEICGFAK